MLKIRFKNIWGNTQGRIENGFFKLFFSGNVSLS